MNGRLGQLWTREAISSVLSRIGGVALTFSEELGGPDGLQGRQAAKGRAEPQADPVLRSWSE